MPLSGKDDVVTWIRHFRKSDNKMFKGDDKKQRWKRAVAAWMKAKNEVKESLDTPKSYRKRSEQHYTFRSGGEKYTVDLTHFDRFLRVDFFVGDYDERITNNQGTKALSVLATVVKVVMDYLKDHSDIDVVQFEGNNDRYGLYKKIATVMSKRTGWKMKEVPYSSVTLFRFMNEEVVNELFDKPAKYTNMFNDVQKFDTKSGKSFVVFSSIENNMLDIAFTDGAGRDNITGMLKSESIEVFSTVLKIVKDILAKNPKVNKIEFGSSDDKSRSGLYKRIAEKFATSMKWKLTITKSMFGYKYIIENPKANIQESKELKQIASNKWRSPKGGFTVVKQNNGTFSIFRKDKAVGKGYKTIGAARKVIATKLRNLKESNVSFNIKDIPDERREKSGLYLLKHMVKNYLSSKNRNSNTKAYEKASIDFKELAARKKNKTHEYLAARIAQTYDLDSRQFYNYLKNKRLAEDIEVLEEGRDAPLYHGTTLHAMFSILNDNAIRAVTYQSNTRLLKVPIRKRANTKDTKINPQNISDMGNSSEGVSLSRKFDFSASWSGSVVFEFDQRAMVRDGYKIVPFHYFSIPKFSSEGPSGNEYEEFLLGPMKNVKKYLKAIYINIHKANEQLNYEQIEILKKVNVPLYMFNSNNMAIAHRKKIPFDFSMLRNSKSNVDSFWINTGSEEVLEILNYNIEYFIAYNENTHANFTMLFKKPNRGWEASGITIEPGDVAKGNLKAALHTIEINLRNLRAKDIPTIDKVLYIIKKERPRTRIIFPMDYEKWKKNMSGLSEDIEVLEEGRDAPLYHGCSLLTLFSILDMNTILGKTNQLDHKLLKTRLEKRDDNIKRNYQSSGAYEISKEFSGVSLSRSFGFASAWNGEVVIELDQRAIVRNGYKLVPMHYWTTPKWSPYGPATKGDNEYEEFLLGTLKNVKKYIKAIYINPRISFAYSDEIKEKAGNIPLYKMAKHGHNSLDHRKKVPLEEEVLEEGRDAPLYHATNIEAFLEIISKDTMRGLTIQKLSNLALDPRTKTKHRNKYYGDVINGISTTRQYQFAKRWADARYKADSVIIEFDQRKLTHNHKMVPIDFWETPGGGASDEFEEFVLGDIKYFGKYVNAIYVHSANEKILEWVRDAGIPIKNIQTKKIISEEAPTTNAGGGMIAGIGVGPKGEPGGKRSVMNFIRRKKKKSINNKKDET